MSDMLNEVKNLKLLLHNHFYNDQNNINSVITELTSNFNLFSINYQSIDKSVQLKIKKTNMKKTGSYSHTSSYYYNILNIVFYNVYNKNLAQIQMLIRQFGAMYGLKGHETKYLSDSQTVSLLYNATTLSDNIVIIYL
jgi:hypothetical protein